MKAILIIDKMPKECRECRLKCLDTGDDAYFGVNVYRCVLDDSEIPQVGKDEYCPLRPLPQKVWSLDLIERYNIDESKYTQSELTQMAYGYNTCIDEILGDEHG